MARDWKPKIVKNKKTLGVIIPLDRASSIVYTLPREVKARTVRALEFENGVCPFEEWLNSLNSAAYVRAVVARITRIRDGNFGDHKSVGQGVFELRIPHGPGLRVYYGLSGDEIVILLGGGNKSTQRADILRAQKLWRALGK